MSALTRSQILEYLPQQPPMRFVSEILELDDDHIVTAYTWKVEDCAGHFPGFPVVPGVKIIEAAGQAGQAWSIHLQSRSMPPEQMKEHVGVFVGIEEASFKRVVRPQDTMVVTAEFGEAGYFRGNKLVSEATARLAAGPDEGEELFFGRFAGMWVLRSELQ